jgi:hypothetical protein
MAPALLCMIHLKVRVSNLQQARVWDRTIIEKLGGQTFLGHRTAWDASRHDSPTFGSMEEGRIRRQLPGREHGQELSLVTGAS